MKFSLQRRQFQALQRDLDLVDAEKTSVYRKRVDGVQLRPYHPLSSLFVTCLILFALSCLWLFRRRRSKAVSYGPPAAERPTTLSSPHAVRVWVAARCIHSLGQHSGSIWRATKQQDNTKATFTMQHNILRTKSLPMGTTRAAQLGPSASAFARLQPWNVASASSLPSCAITSARSFASRSARPAAFSTAQPGARHATSSRRSSVRVHANWGAPVEFKPARIVSNTSAAAGPLHKLVIDVGPLAAGYLVPGQFIQIKVDDSKPGFFAIASAPGAHSDGLLEFLIKGAPGSTAELLCNAASGAEVAVSPVMGKGFPIDRLPASTTSAVLMFATGSGISPIRAVIDSGALAGRDLTLYYGTRNTDSTAYLELLPDWEAKGVKVVQVFSESKQGYVHDVFEREGLSRLPANAASAVGALMCGHKGMCQAITSLLTAKGVPPEKILLNF